MRARAGAPGCRWPLFVARRVPRRRGDAAHPPFSLLRTALFAVAQSAAAQLNSGHAWRRGPAFVQGRFGFVQGTTARAGGNGATIDARGGDVREARCAGRGRPPPRSARGLLGVTNQTAGPSSPWREQRRCSASGGAPWGYRSYGTWRVHGRRAPAVGPTPASGCGGCSSCKAPRGRGCGAEALRTPPASI